MRGFASTRANRPVAMGAAALAFLAFAAGCGTNNSGSSLSGKVTYKGEPVTGGFIKLYSDTAPAVGGADNTLRIMIKPDGTVVATNVPAGTMRVAIETESAKGAGGPAIDPRTGLPAGMPAGMKPPADYDPSKFSSQAGQAANQTKYVAIPPKYADPKASGLTWDVKEGANKKDFDLTD